MANKNACHLKRKSIVKASCNMNELTHYLPPFPLVDIPIQVNWVSPRKESFVTFYFSPHGLDTALINTCWHCKEVLIIISNSISSAMNGACNKKTLESHTCELARKRWRYLSYVLAGLWPWKSLIQTVPILVNLQISSVSTRRSSKEAVDLDDIDMSLKISHWTVCQH